MAIKQTGIIKTSLTLKESKIRPLIERAQTLKIVDTISMQAATETLSQANILLDQVIAYKETKTKPINQALKAIRAETKPFEELLEKVVEVTKQKMISYQTKLLQQQREQEAKILAEVEKGKLDPEEAVNKLSTVKEAHDSFQADSGSIKFKPYDGFKVVDVSALPKECLLANEPKIRELMKGGVKVPGVEYFTEMRPTNYRG